MQSSTAFLFTGHLPDLPDRHSPRLPEGMVPLMRLHFRNFLKSRRPGPVYLSLAAGADLVFAHEALEAGYEIHAVIPCPQEQFLRFSVWPYEENAFYSRLFEKVASQCTGFSALSWEDPDKMPDFRRCNEVLMEAVRAASPTPEAVVFLAKDSSSIRGGSQDFVQQLQQEGFSIQNLYPDFSPEEDAAGKDYSVLMPVSGTFQKLDADAVRYQKKWKSGIRLSLSLFAVVIVLSAFDGVGESVFGPWAANIKNVAVGAALLAAVLEITLNPRKGSGRKEWIVSRAMAEKLRQEFWLFLFTSREEDSAGLRNDFSLCRAKAALSMLKPEKQISIYHRWRVLDQLRYFDRKVHQLGNQLKKTRIIQRSLLTGGILYGLARLYAGIAGLEEFYWIEEINLLACMAGVAVVLGNYQESVNMEDLYFQYREMAGRLREWEVKNLNSCTSFPELEEAVTDAENLLAAQNNEWSIRLT